MNKTLKIIFIAVAAIVIVLSIAVLLLTVFTGKRKGTVNADLNGNVSITNQTPATNTAPDSSNTNTAPTDENTNVGLTNTEETPAASLETSLKTTASNFAERFGSYSNQSNFENITKLMIYMSESMQKWANQYIEEQNKANPPEAEYYGITTKALSTTKLSLDEDKGTGEFTVTTQRREFKGNAETATVFYQDVSIKFIKEEGAWKVNKAEWGEKK